MTVEILRILRNNNVHPNVTEWLPSPGGTKFSKPIDEKSKELNFRLTCFYTYARKKDGTCYKSSSIKSITAAIDRFLRSSPHNKQMDEKALSEIENLIKQLFHSPMLDTRLLIANSALRASLAVNHLISNAGS